MKQLSLLILVFAGLCINAQEQQVYWVNNYGGQNAEIARSVAVDDEGNVYITGTFNLSITIGNLSESGFAGNDVFVAKLSPEGTPIWLTTAGGFEDTFAYDIGVDDDSNVYICGKFKGSASFGNTNLSSDGSFFDAYVARLDDAGQWLWARKGGGPSDDSAEAISVSDEGAVFVTGYFQQTALFQPETIVSEGETDVFLGVYTSEGSLLWIQDEGGESSDAGWGIHLDNDNNLFVTGEFINEAQFDTITVSTGNETDDMFLARYSVQGNIQWLAHNSSTQFTAGIDIDTDNDGAVYLGGYYTAPTDFGDTTLSSNTRSVFLGRYTYEGDAQWIRGAKGGVFTTDSQIRSICTNNDDRVYVTGYFNGDLTLPDFDDEVFINEGNSDSFFITYDESGDPVSAEHLGTSNWEAGYENVTDAEGRIYLAGGAGGTLQILDGQIGNNGDNDVMVAKISPCTYPSLDLVSQSADVCENQEVEITLAGSELGVSYVLEYDGNILGTGNGNDGSLDISFDGNLLGFGSHSIPVEVIKEGCIESFFLDIDVMVNLFEVPEVEWDFLPGLSLEIDFTDVTTTEEAVIDSWLWEFGDGAISLEQNPTHVYPSQGIYNACLTVLTTDLCGSTLCQDVLAIEVGVETLDMSDLVFYPNPATDVLNIRNDRGKYLRMEVLDISGSSVLNLMLNPGNSSIDVSEFEAGIYVLKITDSDAIEEYRFIKR